MADQMQHLERKVERQQHSEECLTDADVPLELVEVDRAISKSILVIAGLWLIGAEQRSSLGRASHIGGDVWTTQSKRAGHGASFMFSSSSLRRSFVCMAALSPSAETRSVENTRCRPAALLLMVSSSKGEYQYQVLSV